MRSAVLVGWCLGAVAAMCGSAGAQAVAPVAMRPVALGESMPAFALPTLAGGEVSLKSLRGRNVVMVFPRVQYGEGQWCTICNYGYAELAALEASDHLRKKYEAEIVFVVPFAADHARRWIDATPAELRKVQEWKNPPAGSDEKRLALAVRARRLMPADLALPDGPVATPFPILLDTERKLTGPLGLFTSEWSGRKIEQLIPSVFVLDKQGVVRYKHIAQNSTWDRPTAAFMLDVLALIADAQQGHADLPVASDTRAAIERACRDYVEGWYLGDATRMRRSLHPQLVKRKLVADPQGLAAFRELTAEQLVANVKPRGLAPGQRVDVTILGVRGHMAMAKIDSPLFVDYVQLGLWNGTWQIVHVMWE